MAHRYIFISDNNQYIFNYTIFMKSYREIEREMVN